MKNQKIFFSFALVFVLIVSCFFTNSNKSFAEVATSQTVSPTSRQEIMARLQVLLNYLRGMLADLEQRASDLEPSESTEGDNEPPVSVEDTNDPYSDENFDQQMIDDWSKNMADQGLFGDILGQNAGPQAYSNLAKDFTSAGYNPQTNPEVLRNLTKDLTSDEEYYDDLRWGSYQSNISNSKLSPEEMAEITKNGGITPIDWSQVRNIFIVGKQATVIDLCSGKKFKVMRIGGSNHADVSPLDKADTAIFLSLQGRSWVRRAIILQVDGKNIAASMHTMPHGSNNMNGRRSGLDGHFCIHFKGSRTHTPPNPHVDKKHQAAVIAAGAGRCNLVSRK